MRANKSKSYLRYFNKLVHQYNNTYHYSTDTKPINGDYSASIEKLRQFLKFLNLKLLILRKIKLKSMLLSIRIKVTLIIGQEKYLLSILSWKLTLGLIKVKI